MPRTKRSNDSTRRAVFPLTSVIYGPLERAYASARASVRSWNLADFRALASRVAQEHEASRVVASSRGRAALTLAAKRLDDVSLDTAWRAALRGDTALARVRMLPHVTVSAPKRAPSGTPWRATGWLTRRT